MVSQARLRREWEAKLQQARTESSGAAKAALADVSKQRDALAAEVEQLTQRVVQLEKYAS